MSASGNGRRLHDRPPAPDVLSPPHTAMPKLKSSTNNPERTRLTSPRGFVQSAIFQYIVATQPIVGSSWLFRNRRESSGKILHRSAHATLSLLCDGKSSLYRQMCRNRAFCNVVWPARNMAYLQHGSLVDGIHDRHKLKLSSEISAHTGGGGRSMVRGFRGGYEGMECTPKPVWRKTDRSTVGLATYSVLDYCTL